MHTQVHHRKIKISPFWGLFLSTALTMAGCAGTDQVSNGSATASAPVASPNDPFEGFNRPMYNFNMGVDKYLMKPVADGYKFITPDFMETGVTNFFSNLKGLNVVLNDMLQGKFGQSVSDLGRFTTNSTIGVLGLFDVATDLGMPQNHEDFGQTLAVWGVDQGPYLIVPFLGPTTIRDGGGGIIDRAANPGTYLLPGVGVLEGISERANAEGALNFIDEAALDPYVFTRESFLQYRQNLATDGKVDTESMDLDVDSALEGVEADEAAAGQDKSK